MEGKDSSGDANKRRATLRDVAELAGTSIKTVSRVINGEGGVRNELQERVRVAISQLGYHPDDRARRLRRGSGTTGTIGLVQHDVGNPFFASVFMGVEEVATRAGYVVLAASSDGDVSRFNEIVDMFIGRRVDGLVVVPVGDDVETLADEVALGTPVVFIDRMPSSRIGDIVLSDHFGGSLRAVQHLISAGHSRIAFLGDDPTFFSAAERRRGWSEALTAAGLETPHDLVRESVGDQRLAEDAVLGLMTIGSPPTALFAAQNYISIGAIRALRKLGLADSIAMVGFDDVELADMLEPALTVAPQHPAELGRQASELLFRRISGDDGPLEEVILPVELVVRGSGEIRPRADDDG